VTAGAPPLADGLPEAWASEWGEDRFGPFTSFTVDKVVQRLRWVPPGRFLMGSPEGEAGRWGDEGPQHRVDLRHGLWVAETPCTQALWQAVMGENPSRFVSADRPVEQVSWDDCQAFLLRIEALVPGLGARLPTEAEWEYACRGGTTGATWVGELDLRGANDAPVLDGIAWYGGNSGVGFDLTEGEDSSGWREKQFPHTRAGTRPVGRKLANPLGLRDMLGNVYEWCEDWFGTYAVGAATDPRGPTAGSDRVLRGGSWDSSARSVRAAIRYANVPGSRFADVGFRLVRGQGPGPGAEPADPGAEPASPGSRSGPEPRGAGRVPGPTPERDAPALRRSR
jgi:formylglycine-generating enzyme required for sulfatase activity